MLDQSERNQITAAWSHSGDMAGRPHVLMRPRVFMENLTTWCCLYGENLQDGVAGFGSCPREACADFDRHWNWSKKQIDECAAQSALAKLAEEKHK